jgi:hypothetical protein
LSIPCPHTHLPEHTLNDFAQSTAIETCSECHGLIQYCPHCQRANRFVARYCVECGTRLKAQEAALTTLLRPGEIRQAAQAPSHYSLDDCLQLSEGHRPFMWFSTFEGLLLLSRDKATKTAPLALHFLPNYDFDMHSGLVLSKDFPAYTTWIQKPLISEQGLFIATENELQFFSSHGYASIFEPQSWQPPSGCQIRAIALNKAGHPFLLISDQQGHLLLFLGNAQSGQWGETVVDLNKQAEENGYAIAISKAMSEYCAIYDGQELLLLDLKNTSVEHRLSFSNGIQPARLFSDNLKSPYFEPFLIGPHLNALRCIIPMNAENEFKAGVVRFEDTRVDPPKTQAFSRESWLLPDPWGLGFVVWSEEGVQRYEGHQARMDEREEGGNFSGIMPLQTPQWFVAQSQSHTNYAFEPEIEILCFSAHQHEDRYHLNLACRPKLSNASGIKVPGMPPLHAYGRLFIALQETQNETTPITVYTMQIAS